MKMADQTVVLRRNRPGTKAENFYRWCDEAYEEMDSTLVVQQYIQQTIRVDHNNIDTILNAPETQDEGVWKYEHLRQFCMELNGLAVRLQGECQPATCTQMTATEQWIFLCAAHKTPKECPAIDYTRHTLDGAACLLNSNNIFLADYNVRMSEKSEGSEAVRIHRKVTNWKLEMVHFEALFSHVSETAKTVLVSLY
nr:MOB-like protein phocein [Cherax quadricarinatus]